MDQHTYTIPDDPKMLRETLCLAQNAVATSRFNLTSGEYTDYIQRLQRLINECDRKRPLGPNGKHGTQHTDECGCEDK